MNKIDGKTLDITQMNLEKIKELFPSVFIEGKIDFEKLKTILGDEIDDRNEKYHFTWNGKFSSIRIAQTPSTGTLLPNKEESKNWDTTENLYIEGDNLEVLKLLQKTYFGKIKLIYVDPPYNTGNDIIYKNNFHSSLEQYKNMILGDNLSAAFLRNSGSDGRYHTNWLNMIYPRIILGRNLLSNDGIFIIAIDDYEQARLKLVCDEIFGEMNFVGTIITKSNPQGRGKKNIDPVHEYHLVYAKNIDFLPELKIIRDDRDENSQTQRHASEFWMIEPEMAFADLEDMMEIAEEMVKYIVKDVMEKLPDEMDLFNQFVEKGLKEKLNKLSNSKFERITHKEAISLLINSGVSFENKPEYGKDLAREHERYLTDTHFNGPVFVTDWPKDIKAFYMRLNSDNETVRAVDLLVPGSGELIGGSQREERLEELINRMDQMNVPKEELWWYLDLRRYGGCVHSGFGMGFERMIMYLTGVENIRDVIPFPRTPRNAEF